MLNLFFMKLFQLFGKISCRLMTRNLVFFCQCFRVKSDILLSNDLACTASCSLALTWTFWMSPCTLTHHIKKYAREHFTLIKPLISRCHLRIYWYYKTYHIEIVTDTEKYDMHYFSKIWCFIQLDCYKCNFSFTEMNKWKRLNWLMMDYCFK